MDLSYSVVGLLVGILIGMTGMGGGALMTPVLILLLGVKPTVAVGSDLTYAAITKILGAFQHRQQGTVNCRLAWRMAIGSVPGSIAGVAYVHALQVRLSVWCSGRCPDPRGRLCLSRRRWGLANRGTRRQPYDREGLQRFAKEVMPAFR